MEDLKGERTKHLRNLTRLKNEISALRTTPEEGEDKYSEKLVLYDRTFVEFSKAHEAYVEELTDSDAKVESATYYQPKAEEYRKFSDGAHMWLKARNDDDTIRPEDSASNCSKGSKLSSVASSARMEEEAKLEGLKAKAELLRKGRELDERERLLQQQKEDYQLELEIKMAEAKASVYRKYERPDQPDKSEQPLKAKAPPREERELSALSKMMLDQQRQIALPKRDLQVFDGKVQDYRAFITAFEHSIEKLTDNNRDRLYYLQQYTSGRPRELVRSCMGKDACAGYNRARMELEEEYGDEFQILSSYRNELEAMQPIKGEDASALKNYLTFCVVFNNAIEESKILRSMDQTESIRKLVGKLPYRMRVRWRQEAFKIKEKTMRLAKFQDYVKFVREQVKVATDSVYGDISYNDRPRDDTKFRQTRKSFKGFSTVVQDERQHPKSTECLYCKKAHAVHVCRNLGAKPHEEKLAFLRSKGLCFRCLEGDHMSRDCKKEKLVCDICRKRHPTVLHYTRGPEHSDSPAKYSNDARKAPKETAPTVVTSCVNTHPQESTTCIGAGVNRTSLPIVPIRVRSRSTNMEVETYAFIDSGSTDTFISEQLAQELYVKGPKTKIMLSTLPNENTLESRAISSLEVTDLRGSNSIALPTVFTTERIPVNKKDIVTREDLRKWPYLDRVILPNSKAVEVGMLIGNNVHKASEPWEVIHSQDDGPYAIRTCLGWTVNGPIIDSYQKAHVNFVNLKTIDQMLTRQFNYDFSERISEDKPERSREDNVFMSRLGKSVKMVGGHYETALPLKREDEVMPNNKDLAVQWALNTKRRFRKDAKYLNDYTKFMQTLLDKEYAVPVPGEELIRDDGKVWYLPHHGVYHPQKKKIRVVFNCAASFKGSSLNDKLLQGPDLTNSLVGVLHRSRLEPVAIMADIEAMFCQVRVEQEHCDLMRFLWWPNGNTNGPMKEYRMKVHLFGAVSSPSCANYALHKTADDFGRNFDDQTVQTVKDSFYVDDMLKSVETEGEAIKLMEQLRELTSQGGFHLTKWVSNSRLVLEAIPEGERAEGIRNIQMDKEQLPMDRALGVTWCVESDQFQFRVTVNTRPYTRKGILSIVASIYDPLGFLAPFVLVAKKILQDLCRMKLDWDDEIPTEHLSCWKRWLTELPKLSGYKVDRCLKSKDFGKVNDTQLHVFSDASESGYGVVAYIRYVNEEGKIHCAFVTGKSRVTPLKQITVPRLELTAATVAAKLYKALERDLRIEPDEVRFWTDSTTVIRYVSNSTARYHTFVANRVATITDASEPSQWSYVESATNPADDASRGLYANEFIQSQRWINGPEFLWKPVRDWPSTENVDSQMSPNDPEVKKKITVAATSATTAQTMMDEWISRYSSWFKLRRHVAWMLKLMSVLKDLSDHRKSLAGRSPEEVADEMRTARRKKRGMTLSVSDLDQAESAIVRNVQRKAFCDEIATLRKDGHIRKSSPIYKLDPKLIDGVLRVGGRLVRSAMPEVQKHPCILPKDSVVSRMIIREMHALVHHGGRALTLALLRKRYWVASANALVRKCIHQCVTCRHLRGQAGEQKMSDLPTSRVTPDEPPFTRVGVDYFGPFEVKQGRSLVKRYGVIFTCFATRAVHLEVAHSVDTDSCINALRRFISRRGQVVEIWSDNGTNLVATDRELKKSIQQWNRQAIQREMLQLAIDWKFNPPTQWVALRRSMGTSDQNCTADPERHLAFADID